MASVSVMTVVQEDAAGQQQHAVSAARLQSLPVETLLEILSYLDFESLDNMLLVSRRLNAVVESHWALFLPDIIEQEFSPVRGFFDTLWDVDLTNGTSCSQLFTACNAAINGLQTLLNRCRAIRRWEMEFPALRFAEVPQHSRILSRDEIYRLRQALYIWWRYARLFHGPAVSADNSAEARRTFMRQFSTTQLHEVSDMWRTIQSAVEQKICPSVDLVRGYRGKLATNEEAARIGWGNRAENLVIVDTMMKLHPDNLLHLLMYRHRYATKASVVRFIRLRHPGIEDSVQTFGEAIGEVMFERRLSPFWPFPQPGFPEVYGGILDHEEARFENLRDIFSLDGGFGLHEYPQWRRDADAARVVRAGRLEPSS